MKFIVFAFWVLQHSLEKCLCNTHALAMEFSSDWISTVFFLHYFSYENINYIEVKWRVICIQATVAVGIKRALQTNVEIATPRRNMCV